MNPGAPVEFFRDLQGFRDFAELGDPSHYREAPRDWIVVITDVEGSTKAIQEGRYKTVNMVGAATVAALVNAVGSREIPFVFGGDGSTALVPASALPRVKAALARSRAISERQFGLRLRIGLVPHADLIREGSAVQVARFELAPGNAIAFFRGRGLSLAESWVKSGRYLLETVDSELDFDPHRGLSCRWAPLANARGLYLSILIKINETEIADSGAFSKQLLGELDELMGTDESCPVRADSLAPERLAVATRLETMFRLEGWTLRGFLRSTALNLFVRFLNTGLAPRWVFDMRRYKDETVPNSDYRKFDEMVRMVVDVNGPIRDRVRSLLEDHRRAGRIFYGLHESDTAIMTCFVQEHTHNRHLHFIDGGGGGYAMAARELKRQMKAAASAEQQISS